MKKTKVLPGSSNGVLNADGTYSSSGGGNGEQGGGQGQVVYVGRFVRKLFDSKVINHLLNVMCLILPF